MKLICCNLKMNLLKKDIYKYLENIENINKKNIIFFPSIPYINDFYKKGFTVGSQDISFLEFGSVTGDTSILQLKELGISYTIIGHSERRKYFDDDKYISKKIKLAIDNNIKVILCIGETIKSSQEETNLFLKEEIDDAISNNLYSITNDNLLISYEPIWSIGSGIIPSNNCLLNTISFIKEYILDKYKLELKVLYGGSVKLDNINLLEKINIIDGYLIASEALKSEQFLELIQKIN